MTAPQPGPADGALVLDGVVLTLNGRRLLGPVDQRVPAGEVVTLMGPSGCGKSSLLAYITGTLGAGLLAQGRVLADGVAITTQPPEARRMGILFQDDLLFPHLSVGENLAFGVPAHVRDKRERQRRVAAALDDAGLAGFERRDPATLSGGQRQRIALMRTLLAEPRALLLDEPFARLDVPLRQRMRQFVFSHARQRRLPTLLVTHDPADAEAAGGPVVALEGSGAGAPAAPEAPSGQRGTGWLGAALAGLRRAWPR